MSKRKSLSENLLDEAYDKLNKKLTGALHDCKYYSIVFDGWSNVRLDHIPDFISVIDEEKQLFHKSLDASNFVQSSANFFADKCEVTKELGAVKFVSVITDNPFCMKKALELIREKYPKVFGNGCAAHTKILINRDNCNIDQNSQAMNKAIKLSLHQRDAYSFGQNRKIKANLKDWKHNCLPVPTRFYSRYNCVRGFLDNKGVISLLSIDHVIFEVRNQQKQKRNEFFHAVWDRKFCETVKELGNLLCSPSQTIGKFENNSSD